MISSVFPGEIPGRSRLALLGRRGFPLSGSVTGKADRGLVTKVNLFYNGLTTVTILFSKPLDQATVNAANFQLKNSLGDVIEPVSVSLSNGDRTVLMTYLPLPIGTFDVVIKASAVTDRAGNALGLIDQVSQFILVESRVEWIGGDGFWDQGSNWNTGVPPGPDDRVFIDVVADNNHRYTSLWQFRHQEPVQPGKLGSFWWDLVAGASLADQQPPA